MKLSSLIAVASIGLASIAGAAAGKFKAPVAVLPFKNLNADAATDWLKLGVAETMLTDLKKAKVTVVERDQIDRALGEILLQNRAASSEDGEAIAVGKLVGAKTVVVGSFQAAGKQLRFNARFVEVETGVILDSAKTTGPMDQVFALQDQVVDKLLGADAAKAARPVRKQGAKTVEAYKLYAMSLNTASDADRVGLLRKSLSLDPAFVYAADELAALEKRLAEYSKTRDRWVTGEEAGIWKLLQDPAVDAQTKSLQAGMLLGRKTGRKKYKELIEDSKRIVSMNLAEPPKGVVSATETALFTIFSSYQQLQQKDLAMQAGEELMRRYPDGVWFSGVETHMRILLDERRKLETELKPEMVKKLAEIDAELAALETSKEWEKLGEERRIDKRRGLEMERCNAAINRDHARAASICGEFVEKWKPLVARYPVSIHAVRAAQFHEVRALFYQGKWKELLPKARQVVEENPDDSVGRDLKNDLERNWPKEEDIP